MNKMISYVLVGVSLILLLAPDYILSKDSNNSIIKTIYNYHQIIAGIILVLSYYLYNGSIKYNISNEEYDITTIPSTESNVNSKS